ncbi:MAG: hypothetical protein KY443_02100 [Actinobacteria bacterium]|nr:hypothetical protein [Actinomycetota bacterium]
MNPATTYELDRGGNILTEVTRVGAAERSRNTSTYANGRLTQRKTTTSGDDALGVTSSTTETADFSYSVLGEEVGEQSSTVVQPVVGTSTTTNNTETTGHDPAGHVKSVDNSDTTEADVTYVYDTADRVISRTETKSGTTSTTLYFYWGSGGTLAEEADGLGRTKVRYLVDTGDEHLAQQSYKTDSSGNRDLSDTTGTWTWLLQDLSGNTGTRLKDDGSVTEQSAFDPYGRPDKGGSQKAAGDETPSTVGFQGAIQDKATGAVLLGARQYDPSSARFTTPDTFVAGALDMELGTDSLTGNRYLFAAANPVAFYEDGHWPRIKVPNPVKSAARAVKNVAKKAVPALGFVPVVGTAIDVVSAATGRDWLDGGRKLSGAERALMLGGAAAGLIPGVGMGARAAVKVAGKAVTKSKTVAKVAGAVEDVRIARKLQRHTTAAARKVDAAGNDAFTERQRLALGRPGGERLQAAFRGNRVDVMARNTAMRDPWLKARVTSHYTGGPDFMSKRTGSWFDMTTRRSWPAHLARYGGRGKFLNTHPRWYWRAI